MSRANPSFTGVCFTQYTHVYRIVHGNRLYIDHDAMACVAHTGLYCTQYTSVCPAQNAKHISVSTVHDSSISTHTRARPHDVCVDAFDRSRLVNLNTHRG